MFGCIELEWEELSVSGWKNIIEQQLKDFSLFSVRYEIEVVFVGERKREENEKHEQEMEWEL